MLAVYEINALRKRFAYSYEQISNESGVPLSTVQKVLGGITKNPRRETLEAISKIFEDKAGRDAKPFIGDGTPRQVMAVEEVSYDYIDSYGGYRPTNRKGYSAAQVEHMSGYARWELIDGVIYYLASPSVEHQIIQSEISFAFSQHIRSNKGSCMALCAPVDIYYNDNEDDFVQPDFMVFCDKQKRKMLREVKKHPVPDFVCEIISPSTSAKDYYLKRNIYREHGAKEYWIIDYEHNKITVENFMTEGGQDVYTFDDKVPVAIFDGKLVIDFSEIKAFINDIV